MINQTTLENGIRVITETKSYVRSVSMGVLINGGPRDEEPGREGLAHLVEHMLFQGTSSRDAHQIARLMDAAGDQMGAFTARDYTCYYATVLDEYFPYALDLLGDVLLNSIFPLDALETEKGSILRELDSENDSPGCRVHSLLKRTAWKSHRLGNSIIGSPQSIVGLTREDLIYFVHEHYVPNRIIITAAGNLDHDDFVAQVRDAFWRLQGTSEPFPYTETVHHPGVALAHVPLSQTYFSIGLPAFSYTHQKRYGLHLLNNILGGGISSRLYRNLRDERGLVYHIDSQYHAYQEGGMLVIEGSTIPENIFSVLELILLEMWLLGSQEKPVDSDELWRAKMHIKGQHLIDSEDTNTCMSRLATQELYFGRHIPPEEILGKIEAEDEQAMADLSQDLFLNGMPNLTIALVGKDAPEHYSKESIEELLESLR